MSKGKRTEREAEMRSRLENRNPMYSFNFLIIFLYCSSTLIYIILSYLVYISCNILYVYIYADRDDNAVLSS